MASGDLHPLSERRLRNCENKLENAHSIFGCDADDIFLEKVTVLATLTDLPINY